MHDLVLTDIISGTGCNEMPIDDVVQRKHCENRQWLIDESPHANEAGWDDLLLVCSERPDTCVNNHVCILDVRKPLDWVWPKDEMAVPFNECVGQKLEIDEIGNIKPCGNIFPREQEE